MKTFTPSLLVSRLLIYFFTLNILLIAGKAKAFTKHNTFNNPGIAYASLTASASGNTVLISWVTVSELNNSHFEVERSTDTKNFKTVAMVLDGFTATGTNGKYYRFKEAAGEVKQGKTVYYRLKQIDNENQVHYSTIMTVQKNMAVVVFPKQEQSTVKADHPSIIYNIETVYTNNLKLLSKQSISSMGKTNTPAASSPELTAVVFNAIELILGAELYTPKLSLA